MKRRFIGSVALMFLSMAVFAAGCASPGVTGKPPLSVVSRVDLTRYMGTWYEIASYPNEFQKGCAGTKATYTLREDGRVGVLNECYRKGFEGEPDRARGIAKVTDEVTNAKLKVTFFWPFYGDYWIIDLGRDYEYAVVGHPGYKYLWVLSRSPRMEEPLYQSILQRIETLSYDTGRLVKTPQK